MLKKNLATLITLSLVSICTLSSYAQQTSKATVEASVEKLKDAMLKPDEAVLNDLAAEELTYGHSSGKIETKKEFIHAFLSGASVFKTIELSDQKISILKNTAIVRHILTAETDDPGKGVANIKLGIVLTWVKVGQSWKLLARQAYRVS
ncbi:nuclear transport factor 2 family protein [Sphingobacterium deserti]|uniref:DUF4440 domain-containing protein n=1 Tax=Sphingobacterium deserti TaxID=1229276 RepID=A0A0B8SYU5_9SPHI|nr:nuclear transport factor 2 family protein [Sphingobacterium deserti]KGE12371.1 hypothetical protein DI53_3860 [Sphingobacterium deserti]